MDFIRTNIPDVILCKPKVYTDSRGYFYETFKKDQLENFLKTTINFCQDNEAASKKRVIRGLHYQLSPHAQAKLVRVVCGSVLDVAVDIRKDSPTFGKHVVIELNDENKHQLFIPKGFAHGYLALTEKVILSYKVDAYYNPKADRGIFYNDPDLKIDWKIPTNNHIVSDKDKIQPMFKKVAFENFKLK